jgi:hypothetical protein
LNERKPSPNKPSPKQLTSTASPPSAHCQQSGIPDGLSLTPQDVTLDQVIRAWPRLSVQTREQIVALVNAAISHGEDHTDG